VVLGEYWGILGEVDATCIGWLIGCDFGFFWRNWWASVL
jgi:hypothetical protein